MGGTSGNFCDVGCQVGHVSETVREAWRVAVRRALLRAGLVVLGVGLVGMALWLLVVPGVSARLAWAVCGLTLRPSACRAPVEAACGRSGGGVCAEVALDVLGRAVGFWVGTAVAGWAGWQLYRRLARRLARRRMMSALRPAPPLRTRDAALAHERLFREYGIPLPAEWWSEAAASILEYLEAHREARGSKVCHDARPGGLMTHTLSALIAAWPAVGELPAHLRRAAVVLLLAHDAGRVVARRDEEHDRLSAILAWRAMAADPDPELRQSAPAVVATLLYRRYGAPYARELEPVVTLLLRVLRREGDAVEVARSVERVMGSGGVPRPPEGFRIVESPAQAPPQAPPQGLRVVPEAVSAVVAESARARLKCVAILLGQRLFLCVPDKIYQPLVEAGRLDVEALAREGLLATAEDIGRAAVEAGVPCEVLEVPAEGPRLSVYVEGSVRGSSRTMKSFFARALVFADPQHPTVRQDAILVLPRRLEVIPESGADPARKRRDELIEQMRGKKAKEAMGHAGV